MTKDAGLIEHHPHILTAGINIFM